MRLCRELAKRRSLVRVLAALILFLLVGLCFVYFTPLKINISWSEVRRVTKPVRNTDPCIEANITIVSAFFDIGDHPKGGGHRKISEYLLYSQSLSYIRTPLVLYTDSQRFEDHIIQLRSRLHPNLTRVFRIKRDILWPFSLKDPTAQLYSRKGYPKHPPNTVIPEYSCAQHSKYACILDLILKRHEVAKTDLYAWLDFGYFRNLKDKCDYCLVVPENLNRTKVLFNQVYQPNFQRSPKDVFYENHVWVGGGMFIASRDTMVTFCTEYHRATEFWLFQRNLSSTDQQVLYASFTEEGRRDVSFGIELQVDPGSHGWFQLGNSCLHLITNQTSPHKACSYDVPKVAKVNRPSTSSLVA